jgi:hypothetical protein
MHSLSLSPGDSFNWLKPVDRRGARRVSGQRMCWSNVGPGSHAGLRGRSATPNGGIRGESQVGQEVYVHQVIRSTGSNRSSPPGGGCTPPSLLPSLPAGRDQGAGTGMVPLSLSLSAPPLCSWPCQAPSGGVNTHKSSQGRADAQRLVTTRLLDRVYDPLGHFSRLQRIYPRAW